MAERGLDDLTIADVVRASGLSVGATYTWFSGKAALVAAACDELITQGVSEGALPADTDVDGLVRGFTALLDGMIVQRIEDGDAWRRSKAEARAWTIPSRDPRTRQADRQPRPLGLPTMW